MVGMTGTIITIGDELLIGQVINTNQAFIAEQLNSVGVYVTRMVTVGDNEQDILFAFQEAVKQSDVVCVTGGLGPTHDDITKKVVCKFFYTELVMNDSVLEAVRGLMKRRNIPWLPSAEAQAMVPRTCTVLPNSVGTAPGLMFHHTHDGKKGFFVVLPGVPAEMKQIIADHFIPLLAKGQTGSVVRHLTLKTTGIPESLLAKKIGDVANVIGMDEGTTLAFLPGPRGTRLRVTVRESDSARADAKLAAAGAILRSKAGAYIYSSGAEEIEDVLGKILREKKLKIAVAESCTGGYVAHRITNVPGASEYFMRGYVTYSNQAKIEELGIPAELIEKYGAVSSEVAAAMAAGARNAARVDIAIATTGIAGPSGGSPEKPVGLLYIGFADEKSTTTRKFSLGGDRLIFKERASQAALDLLWKVLLGIEF